ncbi:PLP-dependent cysteine synthase family protein [Rhodovibrio salinarum]|uniref:Cysteine synthase B n=1 Tax=Rhodovibrio salinarum TaxID=1087 RepID=A0A934QGA2_9PROT|nr:cysteine synthase family protein [Rhodovibrio salinarum]MBK1696228.1 cystathionine beta-synthase [Rhodovibrio salinarum]
MKGSVLAAIGNTPCVKLDNLPGPVDASLWAKLEFANPGGSIKDRIVHYIVADAERRGHLRPGGTIVENTSGNTGAAIAMIAAQKGYRAILTMPDKVSSEKQAVLRALGAEIVVCPTAARPGTPDHYVQRARDIFAREPGAFMVNQYDNPLNSEAHYLTTGPELWRDCGEDIDIFVTAGSTGGTISGVGRYLKKCDPNIKVVLVDPVGSVYYTYFHSGAVDENDITPYAVEGVGEDHLADCMDFSVIDDVIRVTDDDAFATARLLAAREGLLCGGSSGANVWGAMKLAEQYPGASIATILPDLGVKYLSKIYTDTAQSAAAGSVAAV